MVKTSRKNSIFFLILGLVYMLIYWAPSLREHLTEPLIWKHWISDYTIMLQMAEDIRSARSFPFFYYGQNYMGPLASYIMVPVQLALEAFGFSQEIPGFGGFYSISPQAGVLTTFILSFLGFAFWAVAIFRVYGGLTAFIFLLIAPTHGYLHQLFFRPFGPETAIFMSGVLVLAFVGMIQKPSYQKYFVFGLLSAFAMWMNQTCSFLIFAAALYYILKSPLLGEYKSLIDFKDRWRFARYGLHPTLVKILKILSVVLYMNALVGVLALYTGSFETRMFGTRVFIPNGLSPIVTSFGILMALHLSLEVIHFAKSRDLFLRTLHLTKYFLVGYVVGKLPVLLGGIFGWYEKFYTVKLKPLPLVEIPEFWARLLSDYFTRFFMGGAFSYGAFQAREIPNHWGSFGWLQVFTTLFLIACGLALIPKKQTERLKSSTYPFDFVFIVSLYLYLVFIFFVERSKVEYADRYLAVFIPLVILFFITQSRFKSVSRVVLVFTLLIWANTGYNRIDTYLNDTRDIKAELAALKTSNYKTCYANYWDAYLLEYFSGGQVRFIPYESQDRRPKESEALKNLNEPKCLYQAGGVIREFQEEL